MFRRNKRMTYAVHYSVIDDSYLHIPWYILFMVALTYHCYYRCFISRQQLLLVGVKCSVSSVPEGWGWKRDKDRDTDGQTWTTTETEGKRGRRSEQEREGKRDEEWFSENVCMLQFVPPNTHPPHPEDSETWKEAQGRVVKTLDTGSWSCWCESPLKQ